MNSYYSPPPPPIACNHTKVQPPLPPPPPSVCVPPPIPWAPPPYSPAPSPQPHNGGYNSTIFIAVFVSLGGVFFLAFLAAGLFCLAKKKNNTMMVPPADDCVEEHQYIKETITTGPCGEQIVTVTIDDDRQIHEIVGAGSPCGVPPCEQNGGGSSSHPRHHHHNA